MRSLALKMITLGVLRWFCFRILNDLTVVAERLRRVCVKSVVVRWGKTAQHTQLTQCDDTNAGVSSTQLVFAICTYKIQCLFNVSRLVFCRCNLINTFRSCININIAIVVVRLVFLGYIYIDVFLPQTPIWCTCRMFREKTCYAVCMVVALLDARHIRFSSQWRRDSHMWMETKPWMESLRYKIGWECTFRYVGHSFNIRRDACLYLQCFPNHTSTMANVASVPIGYRLGIITIGQCHNCRLWLSRFSLSPKPMFLS